MSHLAFPLTSCDEINCGIRNVDQREGFEEAVRNEQLHTSTYSRFLNCNEDAILLDSDVRIIK